jgi:hypothetical protein
LKGRKMRTRLDMQVIRFKRSWQGYQRESLGLGLLSNTWTSRVMRMPSGRPVTKRKSLLPYLSTWVYGGDALTVTATPVAQTLLPSVRRRFSFTDSTSVSPIAIK